MARNTNKTDKDQVFDLYAPFPRSQMLRLNEGALVYSNPKLLLDTEIFKTNPKLFIDMEWGDLKRNEVQPSNSAPFSSNFIVTPANKIGMRKKYQEFFREKMGEGTE
jgi:hypothetical protein